MEDRITMIYGAAFNSDLKGRDKEATLDRQESKQKVVCILLGTSNLVNL